MGSWGSDGTPSLQSRPWGATTKRARSACSLSLELNGCTLWTKAFAAPDQTGAVGFYRFRTTASGWDRVDYDNIKIDLGTAVDLIGNLSL